MRVLLTGAGGFIGHHAAATLVARGHDVVAIVRPDDNARRPAAIDGRLRLERADLADPSATAQLLHRTRPEALLHAAWYVEPSRYLHAVDENLAALEMTARLLRLATQVGCERFVTIGTGYEPPGEGWPGGTEPPLTSAYASAKAAVHAAVAGLAHEGFSATCAHVFCLYGPGEHPGRLVPALIRAGLEGAPIDVTDGRQRRDYLHVADVAGGLCAVLEHPTSPSVDICTGDAGELREIYDAVGEATGRRDLIRDGARPYGEEELLTYGGDPTELRSLGWSPRFDVTTGMADTVTWWRAQGRRAEDSPRTRREGGDAASGAIGDDERRDAPAPPISSTA